MAEAIARGMEKAGMEARSFPVEDFDERWAAESKCLVLGTPAYYASVSSAVKTFLEGPFRKCQPAGKLGGAFATCDYAHGGGDLAVRLILDHMMVYGMLVYSGGGTYGKPVIHLGPVAVSSSLDEAEALFSLYGERMAGKALELFG